MAKLTLGRDMLIVDTSYSAGAVVEVAEARASELVALGHAAFADPPPPELEARVAELRSAYSALEGTPPGPRPAARHLP